MNMNKGKWNNINSLKKRSLLHMTLIKSRITSKLTFNNSRLTTNNNSKIIRISGNNLHINKLLNQL